ncbi:MAG: helix-turn-helix transcriptional regulator [Pseudomonadota bacterium]
MSFINSLVCGDEVMKRFCFTEQELSDWLAPEPIDSNLTTLTGNLPHGLGHLQFRSFSLEPGIIVTIRHGEFKEAISLKGKDCAGLEIGFQISSPRRVRLDHKEIIARDRPLMSVYDSTGGQVFEIQEDSARDATYVEFSFDQGSALSLSIPLANKLRQLLSKGKAVGNASLYTQKLQSEILSLVHSIAQNARNSPHNLIAMKRDAYAILNDIERGYPGHVKCDRERAIWGSEIVKAEISTPPELHDLAKYVGLSPKRLSQAFQAEFGASYRQFIHMERMRIAADRLGDASLPISRLAWDLGYHSTSYFIQAFKAFHGTTPKQYSSKTV